MGHKVQLLNGTSAQQQLAIHTIAARAECRCSPDFRAGYSQACHGEPPSVALATGPLADPVQVVLSHALSFLREVPGLYRQRRHSSVPSTAVVHVAVFDLRRRRRLVGLLFAAVTHQVRRACFHVCRPVSVELTTEGLTCCH